MGCGAFTAKYLLFCVNFVVTLFSLFIIALGVALLLFMAAADTSYQFVPVVVIVIGVVVLALTVFGGCCTSIVEKPCLVMTFSILIVIAIIANIVLASVYNGTIVSSVTQVLDKELNTAFENPNARPLFMGVEGLFECCGTTGPKSYQAINVTLPVTCCHTHTVGNVSINDLEDINDLADIPLCIMENTYERGCTPIIIDLVELAFNLLFYILIAVICVQGVGVISSVVLTVIAFNKKARLSRFNSVESMQQTQYINYNNPRPNFNKPYYQY